MAEKKVPLASIGIPVFQGENFVDQALRAARAQDYQNLEIVVSDNASTGATLAIIRTHSAEDPRVQYIVQPTDIGAASNYNDVFRSREVITSPGMLTMTTSVLTSSRPVSQHWRQTRALS